MGFWDLQYGGGGGNDGPGNGLHRNFVVYALVVMKFGTVIEIDMCCTMVKKFCNVTTITSL